MPSARHIVRLSTLALASFVGTWLSVGAGFAAADDGASAASDPARSVRAAPREKLAGTQRPRASMGPRPADPHPHERAGRPGDLRAEWVDRIETRVRALCEERAPRSESASATRYVPSERLSRVIDTRPAGSRVSIHLRDLDDGETLADADGDAMLNPASNQKLATAITAVELLGTDYVFETRVVRDGDTLYLIGEGDPSLREADLYALAHEVMDASALTGVERIVVDGSAFSSERFGPGYDAEGEGVSYMAPSGALSLNFNTVVVTVAPGATGRPAEVSVAPASDHVFVRNASVTGAGRALAVESHGEAGRTEIEVRGAIAGGHVAQKIRRRIADPAAFTGEAFAAILAEVAGRPRLAVTRGEAPESLVEPLAVHRSRPLLEVLASALKYSNNFTSEQALRTLAWRATGSPGSWESGVTIVRELSGCLGDAEQMRPINGSGLSREGRASARAIVDLLSLASRDGSPADLLLTAFARGGGEGTLRYRLGHAGALVRAKTGTIVGASALSGVAASADGTRLVGFSILVNDAAADSSRAFQDRLVSALLADLDDRE